MWGLGLLSLFPCLIKHVGARVGVGVWVWLGGTYRCLFGQFPVCGRGGLGTLLGPEKTPCSCVFLVPLLGWSPNVLAVGGCGGGCGFGVWLCVECCIVDASILLWSSV